MLFEQRLLKTELSPNEKIVADYLLAHKEDLPHLTTRQIAKETFTTASTVIRLSQKMGYQGFNELKKDYYNELTYIKDHFQDIDPNLPFDHRLSIMHIAAINQALMVETAKDTLDLMEHDSLVQATKILTKAKTIFVCGIESNLSLIELFKAKMTRIHRRVIVENHFGNQMYSALQLTKDDCALIVSYSGNITNLVRIASELKKNQVPIITLTSIGDNYLKHYASCSLHISTREKINSKIANFSSEYSIMLVLNTLYSTIFSENYEENLRLKIDRTKDLEQSRFSTTEIIQEE